MRIVTAMRVAQNRPWFCNHSWWSTIDEWLQMRPPSPSNLHHYKNEKPLSRHAILFYNLNHMTLENWIVIQMSWFSIMYLKNIQICHKIPSLNPPPIFYSSFFFFFWDFLFFDCFLKIQSFFKIMHVISDTCSVLNVIRSHI